MPWRLICVPAGSCRQSRSSAPYSAGVREYSKVSLSVVCEAEIEGLQNENAQMSASLTVLRERASLAKTLSALGPQLEALKGASSRQESPGPASSRVDSLSSPLLPRRPNGFPTQASRRATRTWRPQSTLSSLRFKGCRTSRLWLPLPRLPPRQHTRPRERSPSRE